MSEAARQFKPHFKWVKIDETRHWNEKWLKDNNIKRVVATFIYDFREVTHLCELTPSYYLRHIQSQAEIDADVSEMTDAEFDAFLEESARVDDEVRDAEALNDNDMYVHCWEVDGVVGHIIEAGEFGAEGDFEDMEEAYECAVGNPP